MLLKHIRDSAANQSNTIFERTYNKFVNKTVIFHHGLEPGWLEELLKQPGGGAHFRVDCRQINKETPTPIEEFYLNIVQPLTLPKLVLLKFENGYVLIRHLQNGNACLLASDIAWILDELDQRFHFKISLNKDNKIIIEKGIEITDNKLEYF